jgi:hypothetical protein
MSSVFSDATPCSLADIYEHVRGTELMLEGSGFLQNVGTYVPIYKASQPNCQSTKSV